MADKDARRVLDALKVASSFRMRDSIDGNVRAKISRIESWLSVKKPAQVDHESENREKI